MLPTFDLKDIEEKSRRIYVEMQSRGICADNAMLDQIVNDVRSRLTLAQIEIETLTGLRIHPNRATDIDAVAGSFGIDLPRTPGGRARTDRDTLAQRPDLEPIIRLKELRSRLSTALGIQRRIDGGRLWPSYVFHPELGRPHVAKVNYMAWSIELRPVLLPEPHHVMAVADFEGMELRVLAALSGDRRLEADLDDGDFHRSTAAHVFGITSEVVTDEQRRMGKTLNFAMLYGSTASGLAYKLRIDREEAQSFIDQWRSAYPKAMQFVRQVQRDGLRLGHVETYHGRRRDMGLLIHRDIGKARRLAINHVIQSTAGDLMRIGLINLWPRVQEFGGRVLGTVHDSYLISMPQMVPIPDILKVIREGAIELNEPGFNLRMKVSIGPRWGRHTEEHRL